MWPRLGRTVSLTPPGTSRIPSTDLRSGITLSSWDVALSALFAFLLKRGFSKELALLFSSFGATAWQVFTLSSSLKAFEAAGIDVLGSRRANLQAAEQQLASVVLLIRLLSLQLRPVGFH